MGNKIPRDILDKGYQQLEEKIDNLFPYLSKLSKRDRKSIKDKIINRYDYLQNVGELNNHSLIDLIVQVFSGNEKLKNLSVNVINAINKVVNKSIELSHNTKFENQIKEKIRELFISIEAKQDQINDYYLNPLNELAFYNFLNKCENIEIIDVERKIEDDKSIDFVIKDTEGNIIGLEVETKQRIFPKDHNDKSLSEYLEGLIKDKYQRKVGDLKEIKELDDLKIVLIIKYNDGLENFDYNLQSQISFPLMMSSLNKAKEGWQYTLNFANKVVNQIKDQGGIKDSTVDCLYIR